MRAIVVVGICLVSALSQIVFDQTVFAQAASPPVAEARLQLRPISELDGSTEEARMHFELAQRYYDTGRFSAAAREFRLAYELTQLGELLYNMFLAHREANELPSAIDSLERYIVQSDDEVVRRAATVRLRRLRVLLAQAERPPEVVVPVQEPVQAAEVPTTTAPVPQDAPTTGGEPSDEMPRPTTQSSIGPWVMMIGGAVVALSAIIPGALALNDESRLDDLCMSGTCDAGFEPVQDRGFTRAVIADTLLIAGVAMVAGGIIWWLLHDQNDQNDRNDEIEANISCNEHGCLGSVMGRF